jgi:hypothetical protein
LCFVCRERRIGCSGDLLQDEIVLFGLLAGKFCWLFRIIWGENSKADLKKSLHSIIRLDLHELHITVCLLTLEIKVTKLCAT